jgi:hypothetical protein
LAFGRSRPLSAPIEADFSNGFPPSVFVLPSGRGDLTPDSSPCQEENIDFSLRLMIFAPLNIDFSLSSVISALLTVA